MGGASDSKNPDPYYSAIPKKKFVPNVPNVAGGWQRRATFRMDTANQEMDSFLTEEMGYVATITEPTQNPQV